MVNVGKDMPYMDPMGGSLRFVFWLVRVYDRRDFVHPIQPRQPSPRPHRRRRLHLLLLHLLLLQLLLIIKPQ